MLQKCFLGEHLHLGHIYFYYFIKIALSSQKFPKSERNGLKSYLFYLILYIPNFQYYFKPIFDSVGIILFCLYFKLIVRKNG